MKEEQKIVDSKLENSKDLKKGLQTSDVITDISEQIEAGLTSCYGDFPFPSVEKDSN